MKQRFRKKTLTTITILYTFLLIIVVLKKHTILAAFLLGPVALAAIIGLPNKMFNLFAVTYVILSPYINATLILLFFITKSPNMLSENTRKIDKSIFYTLIFLWSINIISIVKSVNILSSVMEVIGWTVYIIVFIYSAVQIKGGNRVKVANSLVNSGLILVGALWLKKYNLSIYDSLASMPIINIPDTNYIATFLMMLIPIVGCLRSNKSLVQNKKIVDFKLLGLFYGIFLSRSRGVLAIIIVYYLYKHLILGSNKSRILTFIYSLFIIIALSIGFLPAEVIRDVSNNLRTITDLNNYSNYVRIVMYKDALFGVFPNHPLLGIGSKNFIDVFPKYDSIGFSPSHLHNIFFQALIELGLLGLIALMSFFTNLVMKLQKVKKDRLNPIRTSLASCYLEVIILFILYSLVENTWGDSRVAFLFFIIIGQVSNVIVTERTGGENYSKI